MIQEMNRQKKHKNPANPVRNNGTPCPIPGCRLTYIPGQKDVISFGNHAFLRKTNVTDPALIRQILADTEAVKNRMIIGGNESYTDIHAWLDRLTVHERDKARSTGHRTCIYGYLFRIMVPSGLKKEYYFPLAEKILLLFGCARFPHIIRFRKIGSGRFLYVFLNPRTYDEKGSTRTVAAACARYRNSRTGRICRADHPDAVLIHAKGDPLGMEFTYFGRKEKPFARTRAAFAALCAKAKQLILSFSRLHGADTGKTFCLPRFDYADASGRKIRSAARSWNRAFQEAEMYMYCSRPVWAVSRFEISQTFIYAFQRLGRLFSPLFGGSAMHCRINGRSYAYRINGFGYGGRDDSMQDLFLRAFRNEFNRFIALQTGGI